MTQLKTRQRIRKIAGSYYLLLPQKFVKANNIEWGDYAVATFSDNPDGKLVIKLLKKPTKATNQ